jgi:hypothetical protein
MYRLLEREIGCNLSYLSVPLTQPPPMFVPRFRGLGYFPTGYKPDQVDYVAYESH